VVGAWRWPPTPI